jgi:hypothetical protein
VGRANSNQQMNMVRHAPDGFRYNIQSPKGTPDPRMKTWAPIQCDERALMFSAEDDVAVETEMS